MTNKQSKFPNSFHFIDYTDEEIIFYKGKPIPALNKANDINEAIALNNIIKYFEESKENNQNF